MSRSNPFSALHIEEVDSESREGSASNLKKALKKLREIDALKHKSTPLSAEEREKVSKETYWNSFLPGFTNPVDPALKQKQHKRHMEKEAKRAAALRKQEQERIRRETAAQEKEYVRKNAERMRLEKENLVKEAARKEYLVRQTIENEYAEAIREFGGVDRAFRKLSMKYHPDKNGGDDSRQKILSELRDSYYE
jgi:acyl-CoA reductase-like NAD-dependent aldehyde dehydrogenase